MKIKKIGPGIFLCDMELATILAGGAQFVLTTKRKWTGLSTMSAGGGQLSFHSIDKPSSEFTLSSFDKKILTYQTDSAV